MRKTIMGLAAAFAVTAAGAAPAMACGGYDGYYPVTCNDGLFTSGFGYQAGYGGYHVERLPDPSYSYGPRYYYVNQGPVYSGPGNYGPVPTYQERAVTGWRSYDRPYYYGYNGGPYGDATSHYYDGMPAVQGPVVYRYGRRFYGYRAARHYASGRRIIRVPHY